MKNNNYPLVITLAISLELLFCAFPLRANAELPKHKHVILPSECAVGERGDKPVPASPPLDENVSSFAPVVGRMAAMHVDCNSDLLKGTVLSNFHVYNLGKEVYLNPIKPARVYNPWSRTANVSAITDVNAMGDWGDWVIAYTNGVSKFWVPLATDEEQITLHVEFQRQGAVSTIKMPGALDGKKKQLIAKMQQFHSNHWPLIESYYKSPPPSALFTDRECRDYDQISFDLTLGANRKKFPMGDTLLTRMAVIRDIDGTDYWLDGLDDRKAYHGPNGSCVGSWSNNTRQNKRHSAYMFAPGEFDQTIRKLAAGQPLSSFWAEYNRKHQTHEISAVQEK